MAPHFGHLAIRFLSRRPREGRRMDLPGGCAVGRGVGVPRPEGGGRPGTDVLLPTSSMNTPGLSTAKVIANR